LVGHELLVWRVTTGTIEVGFVTSLVENEEKEDRFWFIAGEGSKASSLGGFPTMEKKKGNGVVGRVY